MRFYLFIYLFFTINRAGVLVSGVGSNLTKNNGSARGCETIDFDAGAREQRWQRKRAFIFSDVVSVAMAFLQRDNDVLGGAAEAATNERSLNLKDGSVRSRRAGFVLHNQ